jgi:hypothetical protein
MASPVAEAAIGLRHHTGWAVCVAIAFDEGDLLVVDRRRIEMVDSDRDAYHAAAERSPSAEAGKATIARVEGAARNAAGTELTAVVAELSAKGHTVVAAGVPLGRALPPVVSILRSHPLLHSAEGELYREALVEAAGRCHLRVTEAPVKGLLAHASMVLQFDEPSLAATLTALGKAIGPPWQKDHKDATLLAWLALTTQRSRP